MRQIRSAKIGVLVMAAFLAVAAVHAQQQILTPEMVVALKTVSSVTIAPSGKNSMVQWNLDVFKNMEKAWSRSPMAYVDKSQTALLVSHGDKDDRAPLGQGWEIYTTLKLLGKKVEFDIYPREAHGWAERNHQLYSIKRNLEWFDKYVKAAAPRATNSLP